jgi:hypothetical protein
VATIGGHGTRRSNLLQAKPELHFARNEVDGGVRCGTSSFAQVFLPGGQAFSADKSETWYN